MKHIKLFKNLTALALSAAMVLSATTVSHAEEIKIGELDCYIKGGEYFTKIDNTEYHLAFPTEVKPVTDPDLIQMLDSIFTKDSDCVSAFSSNGNYPPAWGNTREYDLSTGNAYSGRVRLSSNDYYSPVFGVNIPDGFMAGTLTVDFVDQIGFSTQYIQTTLYFYNINQWYSASYELGFNIVIKSHILQVGLASRNMTKECFVMHKAGSTDKLFSYSYAQPV